MVERTRLNITLYLHCLSCYLLPNPKELHTRWQYPELPRLFLVHLSYMTFRTQHDVNGAKTIFHLANIISTYTQSHMAMVSLG